MRALVRALWLTARNRPVEGEQYGRGFMWTITRPRWTRTVLTVSEPCGCRRRFGLWLASRCLRHTFGPVGGGES